jgi:predicted lipid-binding transport protein (Tim44 family)
MKQLLALSAVLVFVSGILLASAMDADARRFGGGRSFGSKPAFQQSTSKPSQPAQNIQNRNTQQGGTTAGVAPRPGLGGLMGGLLMGGLIGSMFLGGGFQGFNFLDFVILGVVGFLLYRFFAARSAQQRGPREEDDEEHDDRDKPVGPKEASEAYRRAAETWGMLRSKPGQGNPEAPASSPDSGQDQPLAPASDIPPDFDTEDFLKGAKLVFARLQESWGARDVEDLEQLTSPAVFAEIKRQVEADPNPTTIQILLIDAQLQEVKQEDGVLTASVYYDVLMSDEEDQRHPRQVKEIWHFSKDDADPKSTWLLDGIQQIH